MDCVLHRKQSILCNAQLTQHEGENYKDIYDKVTYVFVS